MKVEDSSQEAENKRIWSLPGKIPVMMSHARKSVIQVNNPDALKKPFVDFGQISAHILHPNENLNYYKPDSKQRFDNAKGTLNFDIK